MSGETAKERPSSLKNLQVILSKDKSLDEASCKESNNTNPPSQSVANETPAQPSLENNNKRKFNTIKDGEKPGTSGKRKRCKSTKEQELVAEVAEAERQDIDSFLEDTAEKNNLTVTNVKSILKRIVTNEYVLTMWKKTMQDKESAMSDEDGIPFEPKCTRAKLRELREKYPSMKDALDLPYLAPSVPSGGKEDVVRLLQGDIGDDEGDDEEYQPSEDESDDDSEASSVNLDRSMPSSPCVSEPYSPAPASPVSESQDGTIARRTRSKLPLDSELLEHIEANFIAPDITADMYGSECDDEDWMTFLQDLQMPNKGDRTEDTIGEEEDDPPYNVLEDTEEIDELDWRFDRATKITKTELNQLVSELWGIHCGNENLAEVESEDEETLRVPTPPLFAPPPESPPHGSRNTPSTSTPSRPPPPVSHSTPNPCKISEELRPTPVTPLSAPNVTGLPTDKNTDSHALATPKNLTESTGVVTPPPNESQLPKPGEEPHVSPTAAPASTNLSLAEFWKKNGGSGTSPNDSTSFQRDILSRALDFAMNSPQKVASPVKLVFHSPSGVQEVSIIPGNSTNPTTPTALAPSQPSIQPTPPSIPSHVVVSCPQVLPQNSPNTTARVNLVAQGFPDKSEAIQYAVENSTLYKVTLNSQCSLADDAQLEMSDEYLNIFTMMEERFAASVNSRLTGDIGFTASMVERLREQVKMFVQLTTQLGMLSYAHPSLEKYAEINNGHLMQLQALAKIQANPILNPFNLEPGIAMVEKIKNQRDDKGVHPDFEPPPKLTEEEEARQKKASVHRKAFYRPVPLSVKKLIAWSNVFCFPELLPRVQLVSVLEDKLVKTACHSEDALMAHGLELFSPENAHKVSLPVCQLINRFLCPLRTGQQICDRLRKVLDSSVETSANPIVHFRSYRKCAPIGWKPRRVMLTPVEQPSYCVPTWVRQIKSGKGAQGEIDKLRKSRPLQPVLPRTMETQDSVVETTPMDQPTTSQPPSPSRSNVITTKAMFKPSPVKQISPILKKYHKLFPKPSAVSVNSGLNIPALSSVPLSKSRKEALLRQMEAEKDMPEVMSSTLVPYIPENDEPQSPTSTTGERCATDSAEEVCERPRKQPSASEANVRANPNEDAIQQQLDALMAASTKIARNPKCPRKHRQMLKDIESTIPLLDGTQLNEDEERQSQFLSNYVAKAKKYLDNETLIEMVAVLRQYKDNVRQMFCRLEDTLNTCPALVEDLVLFLDAEQAFQANRFMQHLTLAKMRLFIKKVELHGSTQSSQKLLKCLKNVIKSSEGSSEDKLIQSVHTAVAPLLRGQPHLLEEFHSLFPNARVEQSRFSDYDEIVLSDDAAPSHQSNITLHADNTTGDYYESVLMAPSSPEGVGSKNCPCKCHSDTTEPKFLNRDRHCLDCALKFMDGKVYLQMGKSMKPAAVNYLETEVATDNVEEEPVRGDETDYIEELPKNTEIIFEDPPATSTKKQKRDGEADLNKNSESSKKSTQTSKDNRSGSEAQMDESFWTRERDMVVLMSWQENGGDADTGCVKAAESLKIGLDHVRKRLGFLMSFMDDGEASKS